ncbi:MAG: T9SS type A sorting domain-containing protein [Bacteroidales bacterium]|nr:T9SS type A sorting domain-containing protein [Bacteroidales bacterium]
MKNKLLFGIILLSLIAVNVFAQTEKKCATDELYLKQLETDPELKERRAAIEKFTKRVTTLKSSTIQGVITIPVHFIVVYHKPEENISDAQIKSQIKVLNEDFRKKNADWTKTPKEFKHLVADVGIEFVLQGIERHYSSKIEWKIEDNIKSKYPNYKPETHLNIWTCNLYAAAGYTNYPGVSPKYDGVVLEYDNVGSAKHDDGTFSFPYYGGVYGRTGTHEVGHWLNLYHPWIGKSCDTDDLVEDTPNLNKIYYGCPKYPQYSCGSSDMFMNYMDYTDDKCSYMFTEGQKKRMRAVFEPGGPRASFITGNTGGGSTSKPKAPSDLTVQVNNCSIKLTWKDNSNNEEGFKVYRKSENGRYELIKTLSKNVTSYKDYNVSAYKSYRYYIQAYNSKGKSYSAIQEAKIESCSGGGGNSTGITIQHYTTNCNLSGKARNVITFEVSGTYSSISSNYGYVVDLGNGVYRLRHVGLPFGKSYTYKIYVKHLDKTVATATKTLKSVTKCLRSAEEISNDESLQTKLEVYPDPADSYLKLKGYREGARIQVFNMTGVEIMNTKAREVLDISSLEAGIYMIISEDMSTRFIKK